jgi:hypothetical protein
LDHATGALDHATGALDHATGALDHATGTLDHATGTWLGFEFLKGCWALTAGGDREETKGTKEQMGAFHISFAFSRYISKLNSLIQVSSA